MAQRKPVVCSCATTGKCNNAYCPNVAIVATREARLPAGSAGARAADRLARRRG